MWNRTNNRNLTMLPLPNRRGMLAALLGMCLLPLLVAIWATSYGVEQPHSLIYVYLVLHVVLVCWGGTLGAARVNVTDLYSGIRDAAVIEGWRNPLLGGIIIVVLIGIELLLHPHLWYPEMMGPAVLAAANLIASRHSIHALRH